MVFPWPRECGQGKEASGFAGISWIQAKIRCQHQHCLNKNDARRAEFFCPIAVSRSGKKSIRSVFSVPLWLMNNINYEEIDRTVSAWQKTRLQECGSEGARSSAWIERRTTNQTQYMCRLWESLQFLNSAGQLQKNLPYQNLPSYPPLSQKIVLGIRLQLGCECPSPSLCRTGQQGLLSRHIDIPQHLVPNLIGAKCELRDVM